MITFLRNIRGHSRNSMSFSNYLPQASHISIITVLKPPVWRWISSYSVMVPCCP